MPGILPMKVIKVGSNAQPRIAQACDRCRSKKIRCDGIRPSCTQCTNVGFECKTSDKLSRRAFPRGYTESLEERVRALESEVRELKDLLDEKDEKIDMLSRIRSGSSQSFPSPKKSTASIPTPSSTDTSERPDENDVFKVTQSPILVNEELPNKYVMGTSSARSLICTLKRRLQEQGKGDVSIDVNAFFAPKQRRNSVNMADAANYGNPPARMLSDRLVNIFFQEFNPLFPILHSPAFLQLYDNFVSSPTMITDNKSLAQLYLVFSIASLSSQSGASQSDIDSCEVQWKAALESFISEECLATLQCLTLATLYFMMRADYGAMLRSKGHAVALCERLGLHQAQKRFTFDALTIETRKKVFWSLFTLDCFSAAHLGVPTMISEPDVHCEYPVDTDDRNVTERGFIPSLPGESTKLSSALALFRLARVMWKILRELYPAASTYELSFRKIAALQDELDNWSTELAPHLRLHFDKDKPSTRMISDRSPILSLAYQYTHTLISRPVVLASSSPQARSTPSILSLASSSKRIIQIVDLLHERNLSFAFCLNENEVLIQGAFGLLLEVIELGPESALQKDDAKLIGWVAGRLETESVASVSEFRRIVDALITDNDTPAQLSATQQRRSSDGNQEQKSSQRRGLKAFASRLAGTAEKPQIRGTYPYMSGSIPSGHPSESPIPYQPPMFSRSEPSLSPPQPFIKPSKQSRRSTAQAGIGGANLVTLGGIGNSEISLHLTNTEDASDPADWERLLSNLDNGQTTIYDSIYGGPSGQAPSLGDYSSLASSSPKRSNPSHPEGINGAENMNNNSSWSPPGLWAAGPDFNVSHANVPQSVMSFTSDDNTGSMDEAVDLGFQTQGLEGSYGKAIVIPGIGSPTIMGPTNEMDLFSGLDLQFGV